VVEYKYKNEIEVKFMECILYRKDIEDIIEFMEDEDFINLMINKGLSVPATVLILQTISDKTKEVIAEMEEEDE
jgi:hypothetical protein